MRRAKSLASGVATLPGAILAVARGRRTVRRFATSAGAVLLMATVRHPGLAAAGTRGRPLGDPTGGARADRGVGLPECNGASGPRRYRSRPFRGRSSVLRRRPLVKGPNNPKGRDA